MGDARYDRSGDDIADGRLYLDMPPGATTSSSSRRGPTSDTRD